MVGMMLFGAKLVIKPAEPIGFLPVLKRAITAWRDLEDAARRREDYLCALDDVSAVMGVRAGIAVLSLG